MNILTFLFFSLADVSGKAAKSLVVTILLAQTVYRPGHLLKEVVNN